MRQHCSAAVRRLIALPAGSPSLRLIADQAARVLAGFCHALDGLALLTDDPDRRGRRRGARFHVADWLPALVDAGRAFLAIGERMNANSSKKFRNGMLDGDWDVGVQMAREQVKEGAHVLDLCVDYVGRDGGLDMDELASRLATQAGLPLVFDSTEPHVLEVGLQHSGGKAILVCPSDLAYGDQGRPSIPGGATLVFEIELLDIIAPPK